MTLDQQLLKAHAAKDHKALAELYEVAANETVDEDTSSFFLTQALVFALETNAPNQNRLASRLKKTGRF